MPNSESNIAESALDASRSVASIASITLVEGGRLSIDMDRLCGAGGGFEARLEAGLEGGDDPVLGDLIAAMRWRSDMLPGGRAGGNSVRWAIARQLFEERAFELRTRHDIREIVDAGLTAALDRVTANDGRPIVPTIIMTNPARLLDRRPGRLRRLAHRVSEAKPWGRAFRVDVEDPVVQGVRATEYMDLGDGWLEPESGNRRHRRDVVTLVFREPGTSGRLDVRLVGVERILRLRFSGIDDPAFVRFWSRWSATAD